MANYPQYSYDTSNTELYRTNLYGGTDADLDNTTPVDDTDGYTSVIDLSQKFGAKIAFKFTASGSTDKLILNLYTGLSSTRDGDEVLIDEIEIDNDGTETIYCYVIDPSYGAGYFWFSMQSESSNDTFDMYAECRYWRGEIATS